MEALAEAPGWRVRALSRVDGAAFRLPGPERVYAGVLAQVADARTLASAIPVIPPRPDR